MINIARVFLNLCTIGIGWHDAISSMHRVTWITKVALGWPVAGHCNWRTQKTCSLVAHARHWSSTTAAVRQVGTTCIRLTPMKFQAPFCPSADAPRLWGACKGFHRTVLNWLIGARIVAMTKAIHNLDQLLLLSPQFWSVDVHITSD